MQGAKWIDDERAPNCCSPIYPKLDPTAPVSQRPLWQDVLWGREAGHGLALKTTPEEKPSDADLSRYVDHEFDSGGGSDEI